MPRGLGDERPARHGWDAWPGTGGARGARAGVPPRVGAPRFRADDRRRRGALEPGHVAPRPRADAPRGIPPVDLLREMDLGHRAAAPRARVRHGAGAGLRQGGRARPRREGDRPGGSPVGAAQPPRGADGRPSGAGALQGGGPRADEKHPPDRAHSTPPLRARQAGSCRPRPGRLHLPRCPRRERTQDSAAVLLRPLRRPRALGRRRRSPGRHLHRPVRRLPGTSVSGAIDLEALPAIPRDAEGPVFRAPWEAQAFGIAVALHQRGCFTWKEWASYLAEEIAGTRARGETDDGSRYYEHWLAALERIVTAKGLLAPVELATRKEAWDRAARDTPHGEPIELPSRPR